MSAGKPSSGGLSLRAVWPLIIFAGLLVAFAIGLTRDPSRLPSKLIDQTFPAFSLTDLYDETKLHSDAELKGRVSLVNVFGSWCVACVQEHPNLNVISKSGQAQLIGLNWRDERVKAKRWLKRYGNPYAYVVFDDTSQLAIDLGVTGAPETFVVDQHGQIRYKHVGIITRSVWEDQLSPLIDMLEQEQK